MNDTDRQIAFEHDLQHEDLSPWKAGEPIHDCPHCRYPFQGDRCPNPGCDLNLSAERKAEYAEKKRRDDEWLANFRRFYHRKGL